MVLGLWSMEYASYIQSNRIHYPIHVICLMQIFVYGLQTTEYRVVVMTMRRVALRLRVPAAWLKPQLGNWDETISVEIRLRRQLPRAHSPVACWARESGVGSQAWEVGDESTLPIIADCRLATDSS